MKYNVSEEIKYICRYFTIKEKYVYSFYHTSKNIIYYRPGKVKKKKKL